MNYLLTSPIPVCNRLFYKQELGGASIRKTKVYGFDICASAMRVASCLIIPDGQTFAATWYCRASEQRGYLLLDETLVMSRGRPRALIDMPQEQMLAAAIIPQEITPQNLYLLGALEVEKSVWRCNPELPEPDVEDQLLERQMPAEHVMLPVATVRLLCPEGFYPLLAPNLILGTCAV